MNVLAMMRNEFNVDPKRIYLTGHSMGGYGTWTLGAIHADLFAGLAAFAGAPSCYRKGGSGPIACGFPHGCQASSRSTA